LFVVAPGQFGDLGLGFLVLERVEIDQRHRVDLDGGIDDELHPRQADAVGGQPPPAEGRGRIGEVEHDAGLGLRDVVEMNIGTSYSAMPS
jgi:hypothetical protein